ncbi:HupE/UreJ family protein [Luteimicrobium subarcticum]|uniref:HupE/UreJ protein n=1 Tax=Luteimicrobium subarcticum TaxID=620910 RepID=A0A2M8W716_9MICO|nr:HupE/UreJ family protein [Luteimicrobium subarcticum]PJI86727.1 HupE/UreJ protein [Luteimicrobium subarcticum]
MSRLVPLPAARTRGATPARRWATAALAVVAACLALPVLGAGTSSAHGFSSSVYASVVAGPEGAVRTTLDLEYDVLVVSAGTAEDDPDLVADGSADFGTGHEVDALHGHPDAVLAYVTDRFRVSADGAACALTQVGRATVHQRDGVPYATLVLDHACGRAAAGHEIRSTLFPDSEGIVRGTETIVTYHLDGRSGSAALDTVTPSVSTQQSTASHLLEFLRLGAEHLLTGLDHILFLLALIVGSRRLRDVVGAATSFTLAHSVTFLLAALGIVHVSSRWVEPTIALSIALVAGWYLWRLRARRGTETFEAPTVGRLGMDRADWTRLGIVFGFGLVHGLGFAGALGIDAAWSWTLLSSLLVFNVGIELVQLSIIALVFPPLVLLRRRAPRTALWAGAVVAAGVSAVGLFWFVQRVAGVG